MKGENCSLSGIENQSKAMFSRGEAPADIAKFVLSSVCAALDAMAKRLLEQYGDLPLLFSGGVSSNSLIRAHMTERRGAIFAPPAFSADNAAGVALIGYFKTQQEKK